MTAHDFTEVEAALRGARVAVARHTDAMAVAHATWREETATELVLANAYPTLQFADFNRGEESEIGADWLWWWVSRDGTSFGALVQAKKLTFTTAGKPKVDWHHSKGRQYRDLMDAARDFGVPALYAVYFGGLGYRANWPCTESPPGCEDCARLAINMVPLLTYSSSPTPTEAAELARDYGTPLENLSGTETWWRSLPLAGTPLTDELRAFLTEPQEGAREVAQAMMSMLIKFRRTQFTAVATEMVALPPDGIPQHLVFPNVPNDRLHNNNRYYEHVLRGLRHRPPAYVLDVLDGTELPLEIAGKIAGVGVIRL